MARRRSAGRGVSAHLNLSRRSPDSFGTKPDGMQPNRDGRDEARVSTHRDRCGRLKTSACRLELRRAASGCAAARGHFVRLRQGIGSPTRGPDAGSLAIRGVAQAALSRPHRNSVRCAGEAKVRMVGAATPSHPTWTSTDIPTRHNAVGEPGTAGGGFLYLRYRKRSRADGGPMWVRVGGMRPDRRASSAEACNRAPGRT